jgi:hypothetical protein
LLLLLLLQLSLLLLLLLLQLLPLLLLLLLLQLLQEQCLWMHLRQATAPAVLIRLIQVLHDRRQLLRRHAELDATTLLISRPSAACCAPQGRKIPTHAACCTGLPLAFMTCGLLAQFQRPLRL